MITIKYLIVSRNETIAVSINPDDYISKGFEQLYNIVPREKKLMLIFNGRVLDYLKTVQELGLNDGDTVYVIVTQQETTTPGSPRVYHGPEVTFRGGFEKLLEADIPREDVIRQRILFLAKTGYLPQDQLQVIYMNGQLLPPPRGYTSPRPYNVRYMLIYTLRSALYTDYDFKSPLRPTPGQIQILYPNQMNPEGQRLINQGLSMLSFTLMFLEACVPERLQNTFNLVDFGFINANTPLPNVPLRALQLEILWNSNNSNMYSVQQLGQQNDLLGPYQPVVPVNRVLSSFQRLLTVVFGVLLGLVFNLVVFPFAFHGSMPLELRTGIVLGLVGNIFFALFIGLAGVV